MAALSARLLVFALPGNKQLLKPLPDLSLQRLTALSLGALAILINESRVNGTHHMMPTFHNGKAAPKARPSPPQMLLELVLTRFFTNLVQTSPGAYQYQRVYIAHIRAFDIRQPGVGSLRPEQDLNSSHRCDHLPYLEGTPNSDVQARRKASRLRK